MSGLKKKNIDKKLNLANKKGMMIMLKINQPVQVKKEFQKDEHDDDLGFISELNVLDGSYAKVEYNDGDAYIKIEHLETV